MTARSLLASLALPVAVALGGCAGAEFAATSGGPPAAAPTLKVGDTWTYRGREGFRLPVEWTETHEVTAVAPEGITVRVTYGDSTVVSGSRTEVLTAPGVVRTGALMDIETRRFETPLTRYQFPLAPGASWNQFVKNYNETAKRQGEINRYVRVGGWEKVATPAGTFDAIRLRVLMRLDDDEFWREATQTNYIVWYAPAAGGPVREEKDAEYLEKGNRMDTMAVRAQHTVLELVSFKRAS
jgi:hypothetical protein